MHIRTWAFGGPVSIVWMFVGFMLSSLVVILLLWSLESVKAEPKELSFACNPGSVYTTAECP
jgi:hypothetical protein